MWILIEKFWTSLIQVLHHLAKLVRLDLDPYLTSSGQPLYPSSMPLTELVRSGSLTTKILVPLLPN
jgi:hypothetical protein